MGIFLYFIIIFALFYYITNTFSINAEKKRNFIPTKKDTYKKLSNWGKFVWFGILTSMWMLYIFTDSIQNHVLYNQNTYPHWLGIIGLILLIVFFICAHSDNVYCEYKNTPNSQPHIFSVTGRISRLSFLCYVIVCCTINIVLSIAFLNNPLPLMYYICYSPFAILLATASIRRAQDCGLNSWFPFIPFANILLFFYPSDENNNEYGPAIKHTTKTSKSKHVNNKELYRKYLINCDKRGKPPLSYKQWKFAYTDKK